MKMLLIVLNKVEMLESLLETLTARGVRGATILNSTGMVRELTKSSDYPLFGTLRYLIDPDREESKTIFMILKEEQLEIAKGVVREILGDLSRPNTAIMFTMPVDETEGIVK